MATYEVCILQEDDVLQTSQTEAVPFVPRQGDIIVDASTKFKVLEVRIRYLPQGIRFSVYVEPLT
jgi:hypothetical protein